MNVTKKPLLISTIPKFATDKEKRPIPGGWNLSREWSCGNINTLLIEKNKAFYRFFFMLFETILHAYNCLKNKIFLHLFLFLLIFPKWTVKRRPKYSPSNKNPTTKCVEISRYSNMNLMQHNTVGKNNFLAIPLPKISSLHLISWYGNCAFPQNFHTRKLCEITVFSVVFARNCARTVCLHKISTPGNNVKLWYFMWCSA